MHYSIVIPIYNEASRLPKLLKFLKQYKTQGHEIIFVDDGSDDGSTEILDNCNFIKNFRLITNKGKGIALRTGLSKATKDKIVIFDGDLELDPNQIKKLMILSKEDHITFVLANRLSTDNGPSIWNLGNKLITTLFNLLHFSDVKDSLCCAKSFYKSDLSIDHLKSKKFDIDIEISSMLISSNETIKNVNLNYKRRTTSEGKKLKVSDSLKIIFRIITTFNKNKVKTN